MNSYRGQKVGDSGGKGTPRGERLLFKPEMLRMVGGRSYQPVWEEMRRGKFPLPVIVGGKSAWLFSELQQWIRSLPRRQYKAPDASEERKPERRKVLNIAE